MQARTIKGNVGTIYYNGNCINHIITTSK